MAPFTLFCNGKEIPVLTARVSRSPINRPFGGTQRPPEQAEDAYFATMDIEGTATLDIEVGKAFSIYEIRPKRYQLNQKREGQHITLTVDRPMQFVLETDGRHGALHLFINPPKPAVPQEGRVLYYGPGVHRAGLIRLYSGDRLYIDEGAVVYGNILAMNEEDIKILGRGILDAAPYRRVGDREPDGHELTVAVKAISPDFIRNERRQYYSPITLYGCRNVTVEGIILRDAQFWAVTVRNGCENIVLDNIKLIGMWRYNADGVDLCASSNLVLRNSFIRSFDDCVIARAAYMPREFEDLQNVLVENCVLWCDWGKALEVWAGEEPAVIRNVTFKNNDIIHLSNMAIDVTTWYGSHDTLIENITFRDTYIDGDETYEALFFQTEEGQEYQNTPGFLPLLWKIWIEKLGKPDGGEQTLAEATNTDGYHIVYRNITIDRTVCDDPRLRGEFKPYEGALFAENIRLPDMK